MKNKKTALTKSLIALLLCVAMLIGSTFAWFTDNANSAGNIIKSGNLDIEMYWTDDIDSGVWYDVEDEEHNTIFSYENWEPGYTDVKYIKLVNKGNLALNYKLTLTPQNGVGKLAEVINVYFANSGIDVENREDLDRLGAIGLLNNILNGGATADGTLLAANQESPLHPSGEVIMTIAMNMITSAGNDYQGESSGDFTITALATQAAFERDSFGSNYDNNAEYPAVLNPSKASATVTPVDGKVPAGGVTMSGNGISAFVPAGVALEDNTNKLTLSVTPLQNTTSGISVVNNEVLIPVDIHIDGISENNTVPIIIDLGEILPKYMNMGNYHFYHVENGENAIMTLVDDDDLVAHNQFTYDPLTGAVSVAMASFSEVTIVADTSRKWKGEADYEWYTEEAKAANTFAIVNADQLYAFSKIVGGMAEGKDRYDFDGANIKLLCDINLNSGKATPEGETKTRIFYPIGYYNNIGTDTRDNAVGVEGVSSSVYSFAGTFDGNGHTISNFYHNTWEMFGDYNSGYSGTPNYYDDAMGLFGYVKGGKVMNLTVDSFDSDGEFTPTGVIAAYAAEATFENIAITNCNPRVYNTGNGGIVGIGGNTGDTDAVSLNFTNITIDNTNKISALWGSWDVACGGIMGMFRGYSKVNFTNCHVAAQIDVYNDVCGNYQYYWYRYSGMMIGSLRGRNTEKDGYTVPDMTGIKATACTVRFDEWHDYYYCELVDNSIASYTHDHQFSRLELVDNVDVANLKYTKGESIKGIPTEGKYNYVVLDGGYKTEDATCYHFVNGVQWTHDMAGAEEKVDVNGDGVVDSKDLKEDKQHIYLPFNQLFQGDGWGVKHIPIYDDGTGFPGITILEREGKSVEKFETKFTGNFLYRVGNVGTVSLDTLFEAVEGQTISDSGVWVTIEKFNDEMDASGVFTKSTTGNWQDDKIQFSGTGIVKVTIQDYNYCTPTELIVEVVDATNYTSASISSLPSNNVALLCDTKLNDNGALALQNASLYGNGFTIDVTKGRTKGESISANYLLYMNNATIDNVQVVGAVYTNFDIISSNEWNNPVILAVGNSTIANSYIANCASPVRMAGSTLNIINSTLKGGFFANLDIRGGNTVLDNVTTINQANLNDKAADGSEIAGLGVVVFYEGPTADTTITVKNNLTQYNYLVNVESKNSYANMLMDEIFDSGKYGEFIYTDENGLQWANTGIISLYENVNGDNIKTTGQTNKNAYTGTSVSYSNNLLGGTATLYINKNNHNKKNYSYEFVPTTQYEIVPKVSINHALNQVIKTAESETSCTSDPLTNQENITFANGDSFEWKVDVLKSSNKDITYTVWIDGTQYTDKVVFNESGTHNIVFKYADTNNYRKNGKDIEQYTVEYETSMVIVVSEKAPTAKSAVITFPLLESYGTTKVTIDGKTYIMPNLSDTEIPAYGDNLSFDASTRQYGSVKSDKRSNVDIYYPIIKTKADGSMFSANMVYPVFGNANGTLVQIEDYADGGTGATQTYNTTTQSIPGGLSVVRGYTIQWATDKEVVGSGSMSYGNWVSGTDCMRYQTAAGTAISSGVKANYLSYYPNININTNDRNEQIQVVEYKYVDNKGDTYYYCVGYHIEERNSGYAFGETVPESSGTTPCVTADTLVTLADGSVKRIDEVTYNDKLLVWNFYEGKYDVAPIAIIFDHGADNNTVIELTFSDGTKVKVVNMHQFYDDDLHKLVTINEETVTSYLGHKFAKHNAGKTSLVELTSYSVSKEYVEAWGIMTAEHYNIITADMVSADFDLKDVELFNYFEIGEDMKFDADQMKADIEKYGLYSYSDFADYLTYEQFVAFNVQYFKIPVGKGLYTYSGILELIDQYLN